MQNKNSINKAAVSNPKLDALKILIGEWKTEGTHPLVPGTIFHGRTSFEWIEGGAYLMMRSKMDEKEIPDGMAIFGSDDSTKEFYMLYFDERKVSRRYDVTTDGQSITWFRNAPD